MRATRHAVLALVAAGIAGLSSQGRSVAPGQARLTHIPRSTVKVEQLIGDYDKERKNQPSIATIPGEVYGVRTSGSSVTST